jgi:hypothetical protein
MKNPDRTKWLLRVRDALAEQDEVKRNSMLRAADRFLKGAISRSHSARHGSARAQGE